MANWELSNRETQAELRNLRRSIENMSSTVGAGLAALQQRADHQPLTPENQNLKSEI